MALKRFAPRVRSRLRWHGWFLVLWCVVSGWASSSVLWHGLGVESMALRYGLTAGVVYVALLVGLRMWLDWVRRDAVANPQDWAAADPGEEADQADHERAMRSNAERSGSMLEWGMNLLSFDEIAIVMLIPALLLLVLGCVGLAVQIPLWTTEAVAALLAELMLPLLLGGVLLRGRALRAAPEATWSDVLSGTWWIGLLLVFVGVLVGAGLQWANPELMTIRGLFGR